MTEREELIQSIIEELAKQDLSGPAWDDYDENGIPYWEKWEKMTHEELLAKIDNVGHAVEYGHGIDTSRIVKQLSALRAVVELHKQSGGGSNFCYACSFELEIPYPCPTIQAIEKELM